MLSKGDSGNEKLLRILLRFVSSNLIKESYMESDIKGNLIHDITGDTLPNEKSGCGHGFCWSAESLQN